MPLKRQPTPEDIDGLANEFRPLWRDGDVVRPWLRKHACRLKALLAEGWSWAGLAAVLTQAGITYRTKRPWTANALKAEVSRAIVLTKGRHPKAAAAAIDPTLSPDLAQARRNPDALQPERSGVPLPAPSFKPASLKPYEAPRAQKDEASTAMAVLRRRIFK